MAMQQLRPPPFMPALIFFMSLLSLTVIASANVPTGPLNRHPYGVKPHGRRTLKPPNSQSNFGNSNLGVVGRAHHPRRSGRIGTANHNQGQPGKAYGHHSRAIGNPYHNQKLAGQADQHHSGGLGNVPQNQDQGLVGNTYGNHSGMIGNAQQNQDQGLVGKAYGNSSSGTENAHQNQDQGGGKAYGNPSNGTENAHQNQDQGPGGKAYGNSSNGTENAHQNQDQGLGGKAYGNSSNGTENTHQNQDQGLGGKAYGNSSNCTENAHQNQDQGLGGKAYGNSSNDTENAQQNQDQGLGGEAYGNSSNGTENAHQNQDQGLGGNHSDDTGNEHQSEDQGQAGKSNSTYNYGNGTEGTIASKALKVDFLIAHNLVRQKFNQPLYTWDNNLAFYAQTHAETLSQHCKMIHSKGPYGENIFWGLNFHWKPIEVVKFWYEEYKNYDFNNHSCPTGKKCGHFTQMVWRDSVRLGCAIQICQQGRGMLMICEYDPPGNYENENPFDNNNA